jgi:uncharacterized protein (DUF1778 family)
MPAKTQQLQIRVSPQQKSALRRHARHAGLDVSSYVLARVLPAEPDRFAAILRMLALDANQRFALAELNDFLHACPPVVFDDAVAQASLGALSPFLQNYVAAMVELAAAHKHVAPPAWVLDIEALDIPHFATPLKSLRWHLLRSAPVPFKRRNIFVDASVGDRI